MHKVVELVAGFQRAQVHQKRSPYENPIGFLMLEAFSVLRVGRFHTSLYLLFPPLLILNISSFGWILLVVIFPTKLVSSYSEFGCSSYCSFGLSCFLPWLWSPETPASFWRILRRFHTGVSGLDVAVQRIRPVSGRTPIRGSGSCHT